VLTEEGEHPLRALHTLSAYATNAHLTLAPISVPEKTACRQSRLAGFSGF
jgi:hypothetical protein